MFEYGEAELGILLLDSDARVCLGAKEMFKNPF